MKLAGKVAVVTGGASGIGEFTVREMVEEGAKVVIADLNDDLGSKLVQELNQEERQVAYIHVDVTKEDQVENMI